MDKEKVTILEKIPIISKLKKIKHLDIVVIIVFFLVMLLIAFSNFSFTQFEKFSSNNGNIFYVSSEDYSLKLENKLSNLLSKIEGVGQVSVMVVLEESPKFELVNIEAKDSEIGELIDLNSDSGISIINEIIPKIKGVVIVSSGAKDISVRVNILNATETLLNLPTDKIQVFAG